MKNANKHCTFLVFIAVMGLFFSTSASALDAHSNTKINNAKASAWAKEDGSRQDPALQKQVVNIGSRKNNTCNVNVGTVQSTKSKAGEKKPKDIVVNTKEVINVCK